MIARLPNRVLRIGASVVALALVGLACGSDVCQQAADKRRGCIEKIDCSKLDPLQKPVCEQNKKSMLASIPDVACSGDIKTLADQVMKCDLNPQTCLCPY